ncbi:unnamed protein product [Cochlearia groenlandica]
MVMYLKNNFLLVLLFVINLLAVSSYARFNIKVSQSDIKNICSKHNNPSFCFNFFKSTPKTTTLDLYGVATILINNASKEALSLQKQFAALEKATTGSDPKQVYSICAEVYDDAVDSCDQALKALKSKNMSDLNTMLSAVITDSDTCRSDLVTIKHGPTLEPQMLRVDNLSEIVLIISDVLPKN